jgi:thymidylate synthase
MEKGRVPKMDFKAFMEKMKSDDRFIEKWGNIGPAYGVQWRRWPTADGREIDQLRWVLDKIKEKPHKKHYLVSAWNAANIYEMAKSREESMAIAPCHTLYHIVLHDGKLCLQLYQRSADLFLGVPFNIASYALLTLMLAQVTGYPAGEFVHTFGDVHIYENHFDQVKEQIKRKPRTFPTMKLNPKIKDIDDFKYEDFTLEGYNPYPRIKAKLTPVGGF